MSDVILLLYFYNELSYNNNHFGYNKPIFFNQIRGFIILLFDQFHPPVFSLAFLIIVRCDG
jgi:hypothetical protein